MPRRLVASGVFRGGEVAEEEEGKHILEIRVCMYRLQQVARKLAMVEADLERAEERAEAGES